MSSSERRWQPSREGFLEELADGVWAYVQPDGSWFLSNAGLIRAGEVVVHVDSAATVRRTHALRAAADALGLPRRRVVIATHHHGDHTNGNATLDPELLVAHRNVPQELAEAILVPPPGVFSPVDWGVVEVRSPDLLVDGWLGLELGGRTLEVAARGLPAHTRGDAVVWLPAAKVLFAGDLCFVGGTPFALGGSVAGWIETLAWLRGFDADVVVPGHGPVATMQALEPVERYLRFVWHVAHEAHEAGVGPLEAARSVDLGEFGDWRDPERIVGNLHRALAELGGGEVDVLAAFGDMIAFNGGRPLTCYA